MKKLLPVVLLIFATSSFADTAVNGINFGSRQEAFKASYPNVKCSPEGYILSCNILNTTYAEIPVDIEYRFFAHMLSDVILTTKNKLSLDQLISAVSIQYGWPVESNPIERGKMVDRAIWKTSDLVVKAVEFYEFKVSKKSKVEKYLGLIEFGSPSVARLAAKRIQNNLVEMNE
jgi:hypothetical protein